MLLGVLGLVLAAGLWLGVVLPADDGPGTLPQGSVQQGVPRAPPCSNPRIVAELVHTYGPKGRAERRLGSLVTLRDPRQAAFEVQDVQGAATSTRWCIAEADFGSEGVSPMAWDMFATSTILGVAYGLRPCFGARDPLDPACRGFGAMPEPVRAHLGLDEAPTEPPSAATPTAPAPSPPRSTAR